MRFALLTSLVALLAAISANAGAEEFFCMIHSSGAIHRGCEKKGALILCMDPETSTKSVVRPDANWKRLEVGTDFCVVGTSRVVIPKTFEPVRGDDEAKKRQQ